MIDIKYLLLILSCLNYAAEDYLSWIIVGMVIKNEGAPFMIWDMWSRLCPSKYDHEVCKAKWQTFGNCRHPATIRTLERMVANHCLYSGSAPHRTNKGAKSKSESILVPEVLLPPENYNAKRDIITFLETLFAPDEYVGYVTMARQIKNKFVPLNRGVYNVLMGELIEQLKSPDCDLFDVFKYICPDAGAWVRINPLDGKGVSDVNVTAFRYVLVESDTISVSKQIELLRQLQLPIATLTYSGGKSVHAVVKVDAPDYKVYRKRVMTVFEVCDASGLMVDRANANPSRLSRLPGFQRGSNTQFLIATNIGARSFEEWIIKIGGIKN